ncbi:hypothetical protein O7632_29680 [Solwaraspora sp. WMMD406]|uniref:hypothetical protein n=1 Tax=Solwaraspora sp. WMMD406 TaxID=3016095 RepID=UPI0024166E27|nr:hypothetical protein [Solwaraspora sp. WMMD406]MDG4768229.1 hypothetical protein [Solwaraspora sp. WMMD406]
MSPGPPTTAGPPFGAYPPQPPAVPPPPRWRRWALAGAAVLWIALLAGLAVVSTGEDAPTVREQRGIDEARPVADRSVADLATAIGAAGVIEIGPEEIVEGCRITPIRPGAQLTRMLTAYTAPDDGPALLDQIARRLPARYAARTRQNSPDDVRFVADAGEFVSVRGQLVGPGVVHLRISTGCRPQPSQPVDDDAPTADTVPQSHPGTLLAALGADQVEVTPPAVVPCPAGGWLRTRVATGVTSPEAAEWIGEALDSLARPDTTVLSDQAPLFVQRDGLGGVVVEADGGEVRAVVTTGC